MDQTEEWLYKKAKEVDSELELQDLYTSKFMFGGAWVMDLLEEYHKEQLILSGVSQQSELFVLFADWLQYNGKWMLPKEQVKEFFKQQKETK